MGCSFSSPYSKRVYRDPGDLDEEVVPLKYFGQFRNGSVMVPDDIDGMPSTHITEYLASDTESILYEAEVDQGRAWRCIRPFLVLIIFFPILAPFVILLNICKSILFSQGFTCDEICCWLRKEFSTRGWYRVYSNRIEYASSSTRIPFGWLGCGSWNGDRIATHMFDRGAFGFRRMNCGVASYLCFTWPVYGGTVARQRCPCNGPVWYGGWWCDEWPCDMCFCTYRYPGLADADEVAFASSIALQAYFEGRKITKEDMDQCVEYWRNNISEESDPEGRKRDVCCEPCYVPFPTCSLLYDKVCHLKRNLPYGDGEDDDRRTDRLREVYAKYEELRVKQVERYKNFRGPTYQSTVCRMFGCRRFCGRKGFFFCTEGCSKQARQFNKTRKPGDPFPPFEDRDIDDDNDASKVLMRVLGDPPKNVVYTRYEYDEEQGENVLMTYPKSAQTDVGASSKAHDM